MSESTPSEVPPSLSPAPDCGGPVAPILTRGQEAGDFIGPHSVAYRRGDVERTTGKIFWDYCSRYRYGMRLLTEEQFHQWSTKSTASRIAHRKTHPDIHRERDRVYTRRYRERRKRVRAKWVERNRERIRDRRRERERRDRCLHPGKYRARIAAYRARKREQLHPTANLKLIQEFYKTAARITRCVGVSFHVDHVKPLARGGLHHETNLQVIPGRINQRKGASTTENNTSDSITQLLG